MCSTFHHCIVYNPKCINTNGWLFYQSFIIIIQKTMFLILTSTTFINAIQKYTCHGPLQHMTIKYCLRLIVRNKEGFLTWLQTKFRLIVEKKA